MIDTIAASYYPTDLEKRDILSGLITFYRGPYFQYIQKQYGNFNVRYYLEGRNLQRITLWGSLPKLVYATNYRSSDLFTIKRAIMELLRKSKLPIQKFLVSRLDLGFNIEMDHPVECYISKMDLLPSHSIKEFSRHSIIFQNKSNKLAIYDKVRETEKEKKRLLKEINDDPEDTNLQEQLIKLKYDLKRIQNKNLLRIEYRTLKSLSSMFNKRLTIKDLHQKEFYKNYPRKVFKVFKKLKFRPDLHYEGISKPTDFRDYLVLKGLESVGWHQNTELALVLTRIMGDLSSSHKSTINRYINVAKENKIVAMEYDLIKELKFKVATTSYEHTKNFLNDD